MKNVKGKSIAVFSSKGGTGKTTTVLNIAGILSLLGKKVLIVDFDLTSGAIATYLNKKVNATIYNFVDDYANNSYKTIKEYVTSYNENIDYIPGVKDPRQGVKISADYIDIIIGKSLYEYDFILIDTNHALSEFNIMLLDKVDNILLTLTNDLIDLKNAHNLVRIFNDAGIKNYKFILNCFIVPDKKYFSLYDIKNIIKANIDYLVTDKFYLKNISTYTSEGTIVTLDKKFIKSYPKVYKTYLALCNDLMEETNG